MTLVLPPRNAIKSAVFLMLLANNPMKVLDLFLGMSFEQVDLDFNFLPHLRKCHFHRRPKTRD